jgi:hypothetical protein
MSERAVQAGRDGASWSLLTGAWVQRASAPVVLQGTPREQTCGLSGPPARLLPTFRSPRNSGVVRDGRGVDALPVDVLAMIVGRSVAGSSGPATSTTAAAAPIAVVCGAMATSGSAP